jgi:hypothetical protein
MSFCPRLTDREEEEEVAAEEDKMINSVTPLQFSHEPN